MGLLGAPTYQMLRDATQSTLFEILDSNRIPYEHNKAENTLRMRTRDRGSYSARWMNSNGCAEPIWPGSDWMS